MLKGVPVPAKSARFQPIPQGYPGVPTEACIGINELVTKIYAAICVYAYRLGIFCR